MKIQPLQFNHLNHFIIAKSNFKSVKIPYDSFEKIAFKGNLKFTPAKTAIEAIDYGKNNFGIREYKGFSDSELDTLNWFNEGLFNLKNILNKPFKAPNAIIYTAGFLDDDNTLIEMNDNDLWFNKKCFEEDIKFMKKYIINSNLPPEEEKEKLSSNLTILSQEYDMKHNHDFVIKSPFSLVYHEMGHIQHQNNIGKDLFKQLLKSPKSKLSKSAQELVNLFNKNKKAIASRVSKYATENVIEFVAETYTGLCEGIKYDSKVMDLYRKLGGVEI